MDTTEMEKAIRDLAGTVLSLEANRKGHPSHRITKGDIKEAYARVEGAVGLYMVITGQATHPGFAGGVKFETQATKERVHEARMVLTTL